MTSFEDLAGFVGVPVEQLQDLTHEQRAYLIETLLMVTDPSDNRRVPLVPNAMQRTILDTLTDNEITVKWRRAGLTTVYVASAVINLITRPGWKVELYAHNWDTAKDIMDDVIKPMIQSLPSEVRPTVTGDSASELVFGDVDSRISVGTAGQSKEVAQSKGQARTINELILTEFAHYAYAEDFMGKIENCVPTGGIIRIDSTPNGLNSFYTRFARGLEGHGRFKARFFPWWYSERCMLRLDEGETIEPTDEELALGEGNPHAEGDQLTPEQIKWRRWKLADIQPQGNLTAIDRFRTEYPEDAESCFLHSGRPLFLPRDVMTKTKLRDPLPGHEHVLGMDTSTGDASGHPAGICVLDVTCDPAEQVYEWVGWEPTDAQAERVVKLQERYPGWIVVERNTPGDSVLTLLRRWGTGRVYRHRDKEMREHTGKPRTRKPGFPMSAVTKPRVFTALQHALHNGELLLGGALTCRDLKGMQYDDDDKIVFMGAAEGEAETGIRTHGELAIATALAWHGRKQGGPGVA